MVTNVSTHKFDNKMSIPEIASIWDNKFILVSSS